MTPNALNLHYIVHKTLLKSLQKYCQTVFSRFLAMILGNLWGVKKKASLITADLLRLHGDLWLCGLEIQDQKNPGSNPDHFISTCPPV
jgi:hypothetical protein